jgi:Arc/MetJ family transcription regulator
MPRKQSMRTTVTIDDKLYERALEVSEEHLEGAYLVREAMQTYVRVQVGKRLAALGGQAPDMADIPRREQS